TGAYPQATWGPPIPLSSEGFPPLHAVGIKTYECWADATVGTGFSANRAMTNAATGNYPWAGSNYAANYQLFGVVNDLPVDGTTVTAAQNNSCSPRYRMDSIPDGSSNTVMFGEQFAACGASAGNLWAYPGIGNYAASN